MRITPLPLLIFATGSVLGAPAGALERNDVPDKLKWNLDELYPSVDAWRAAKDAAAKEIPQLAKLRGHLGDSAQALYEALSTMSDVRLRVARLNAYAMQLHDQDTRVSASLEMRQAAEQIGVDFGSAISWVRPEILGLDTAKVRGFVAQEPRLKDYAFFLEDVLRWKGHTLSQAEEKIFAESGNVADTGAAIHSIFTNADLPYPEVTLSSGEKVRLDAAAYTKYRAAKNRADRETVFKAFWKTYSGFTRTLGTSLYAQVKAHVFDKSVHHFDSSLEAALFDNNIPPQVYRQLIADVHANLPTLHRYLALRQKMMGLEDLRYSDLYAPIVQQVELSYTPEQGMALTLDAFAPLGDEYVAALRKGYASRWVDFMPNTGKRSGAYSNSSYGIHPYQLLNFMGAYDDVSTLAHESGHSMHSYLADTTQPYIMSDYSIFVAEVASTLNENLLLHHVLAGTKDDATRLYLLGSYLDNLRQTLFRQTLFAEFELRAHELAEQGSTLTGENLTKLYLDLLREYYGHAQGVTDVEELYGVEWAYIPHFYYNFYVYQYATSVVASLSLADEIRADGAAAKTRDAYLAMLKAGGSKYPIDLLKGAGVDMTTSAPFAAAMAEMNRIMDEMEVILAKAPVKAKAPGKAAPKAKKKSK